MTSVNPVKQLHLTCIFSDDVRQEASGQTTLVGWYTSGGVQMMSSDAPQVFAKLCATGMLEVPRDLRIATLKIELRLDAAVLNTVEIPPQALGALQTDGQMFTGGDPEAGRLLTVGLQLGTFTVPEPGVLRLWAIVNDVEICSNGLRFIRPVTPGSPDPVAGLQLSVPPDGTQ